MLRTRCQCGSTARSMITESGELLSGIGSSWGGFSRRERPCLVSVQNRRSGAVDHRCTDTRWSVMYSLVVTFERREPKEPVLSVAITMKISDARQMHSSASLFETSTKFWFRLYQSKSLYMSRLACFCRSSESTGHVPVSYQLVRSEMKTAMVEITPNSARSMPRLWYGRKRCVLGR
jgi:hypothetical protein